MPPVVDGAKYLQKECFVVFFIPHRHKRGTTTERTKEVERGENMDIFTAINVIMPHAFATP